MNQLIGIGLRTPHYRHVLDDRPSMGWFEVHSENFFSEGGLALETLISISGYYPTSLHGVGLSLGSAEGINSNHLKRLLGLISKIQPILLSEHLAWGYVDGIYMPDLLPLPYTEESLKLFSQNIMVAQDFLQREILIENPSSYIEYNSSSMEESEFLVKLCKSTGAKILLDINNVFVSASNHNWNAYHYIDTLPRDLVKEIHIAGHTTKRLSSNQIIRIDTHNNFVCQEVWDLYKYAIQKFGPIPTLLEWDADIPEIEVLIQEASKASNYLPIHENFTYE